MTSLGIISIAVAYSSQQIIQNFISGLFISFGRHISIGDWVEVAPPSVIGKVKDISSMRITLRDVSGKIHFIPNSLLMTTRVINYSKSGFVEMQVPLTICSSANFESVEKVILDVLSKNSRVLPNVSKSERVKVFKIFKLEYVKEIYPEKDLVLFVPQVMVSGIASDKINLNINFWIREIEKRDEIVSEILLGIREGLGKGKILI